MHIGQRFWRRQGLGSKLAITNFVWVCAILAGLVGGIAWGVTRSLHAKAESDMVQSVAMLQAFIAASDQEQRQRTRFLADRLMQELSGTLTLEHGDHGWELRLDGIALNGDNARMNAYTQRHGAVATVLMKQPNGDYVRIATSLRNAQGAPVVDTVLERSHPAWAAIERGQVYTGLAHLFGRDYMTEYRPLQASDGRTIGISFVGQDFSALLDHLKASVRQLKVGQEGYFYVLRADAGPQQGQLVVHPALEGQSILDSQDSTGRFFIRDMLERKQGVIQYPWLNPGERQPRDKVAAFGYYAPWNWVFVSSAYLDEFSASTHALLLKFAAMGLVAVLVLTGVWFGLVRRMIVRPLHQACGMARALAAGDLTAQVHHTRRDEMGQLFDAMNHTAQGLTQVVRTVHTKAAAVALASAEIAQANMDLAGRTESEASALEETAAAMEQLGSTVAHNAEHAHTADQLTREAQRVVTEGGEAVRAVVHTMQGIDASSQRIADIIGVIDGIAFQTNILALNAAVEAARAGDHGRGFAVVAGEVRQLAQRSAEAAKEIKQLIHTSVSEIHQGNVRAARAGETMEQAITEIQKVTRLITDISHASGEQRNGVAQVGEAVVNMDQTTQKNAALVGQMASATQSLRQQAADLVQAVAIFQLQAERMSAPAVPLATAAEAPAPAPMPPALAPARLHTPATPAAPTPVAAPATTAANEEWESF